MADWRQIAEDFRQRYRHSFIHATISGTKRLYSVQNVQDVEGEPPEISLYNPKTGTVILRYDGESELSFEYPELGYGFYTDKALILSKRVQRQYTRGFGEATCLVDFPYDKWLSFGRGIDMATAIQAYKPLEPVSIADVVAKLHTEKVLSYPLSREWALGQDIRSGKGYILWYLNNPVATLEGTSFQLSVEHFRQEIQDFLRNTRQGEYAIR